MNNNLKHKKINQIFMVFYLLVCLGAMVYCFFYETPYYIGLSLLSPLFLLIPPLVFKLFRLQPAYLTALTINVFSFLAFVLGIALRGYGKVPYFDKFVHFLSGVLFGLLGIIFFFLFKKDRTLEKSDWIFAFYFAVSFSCTVGVLWEIWEYSMNFIFHSDPQWVEKTGVNDTMQDLIACLIGSFWPALEARRFLLKDNPGVLMRIFNDFYQINLKK